MLAVIVILVVVLAVSLFSETHGLGLWLLLMIAHNYIASFLGSSAEHLPLFAGLIIVTTILARKNWSGVPASILVLVSLLLILTTATAIAGLDPARSLVHVLWYSKGLVLAILIAGAIKSDAQVRCLTRYCLTGVLIAVCVTFFEYFSGAFIIESADIQRAGRFTGNPNDTAMLLLIGLPLALYWATHSKSLTYKIAHYVLILLIMGAITLTQSRGGFVTLLLLSFFLYLKKPSINATVIGVVILSAGLLFVPPESAYWKRMGTLVEKQKVGTTSIDKRKHYVKAGVMIMLDEPVLGVGMGNFGPAMIAVDPTYRENDQHRVAHNMYLEFFVENGMLGGLVFMTLLGISFLQSMRYDKRNKSEHSAYGLGFCVAMSLFTLLITGLFDSLGKSSVLWFLVGLCFAFQAIGRSPVKRLVASPETRILTDY